MFPQCFSPRTGTFFIALQRSRKRLLMYNGGHPMNNIHARRSAVSRFVLRKILTIFQNFLRLAMGSRETRPAFHNRNCRRLLQQWFHSAPNELRKSALYTHRYSSAAFSQFSRHGLCSRRSGCR